MIITDVVRGHWVSHTKMTDTVQKEDFGKTWTLEVMTKQRPIKKVLLSKNFTYRVLGAGSLVKSMCCSCRRPGLASTTYMAASKQPIYQAPGI